MKTLAAMAFIALSISGQSTPRTVYVLPMANGLDQYLAQRLSGGHVMKVVADPKIADVILTDRLDEAFEQKLAEIHPTDAKKNDKDSKDKDDTRTHAAFRSSKGKGTIFLVDTRSREVIWSDYEKVPDSNSSDVLNREAERIAKKLQTAGL
jgi:hypothetical protein